MRVLGGDVTAVVIELSPVRMSATGGHFRAAGGASIEATKERPLGFTCKAGAP
jgi:hypothetical protein